MLIAIPVALILIAIVGGGVAYSQHQRTVDRRAQAAAAKKRAAARRERAHAKEVAVNVACHDMLQPLVDAEHDLSGRLDIGMTYADYGSAVGTVSVAYGNVDADALEEDFACLSDIAVPAEAAFNQYRAAYNVWNNCFESLSCDTDSIDGTLQKHWTRAGTQLTKAKNGLEALELE